MFFELVSILFAIVPDYGNEYMTKENKNWSSLKNFAPKVNLNDNIYVFTSPLSREINPFFSFDTVKKIDMYFFQSALWWW